MASFAVLKAIVKEPCKSTVADIAQWSDTSCASPGPSVVQCHSTWALQRTSWASTCTSQLEYLASARGLLRTNRHLTEKHGVPRTKAGSEICDVLIDLAENVKTRALDELPTANAPIGNTVTRHTTAALPVAHFCSSPWHQAGLVRVTLRARKSQRYC